MHALLRKSFVVTALALGATQLAHAEQSDVVRWQSVIGIIQGSNVVGSGTGAATGVPGPWSAQGGHVTVDFTHGRINFDARALLAAQARRRISCVSCEVSRMNYDRPQLLDRLAAEYVLGSMPRRARRRFERLRARLSAADVAAQEWERRLMPLSTPVPALEPPRHVWDAIDRRTGGGRAARRSLPAWLRPALGFALGVLATIGVVRLHPDSVVPIAAIVQQRGTLPESYVGILVDANDNAVVLASSTRHGRVLSLKRLRPLAVPRAGRGTVGRCPPTALRSPWVWCRAQTRPS